MLNSKALEAGHTVSAAHHERPLKEWEMTALRAAITAYLEALLPADVTEVVERLQNPIDGWSYDVPLVHPETAAEAAALLQAQAAENAELRKLVGEFQELRCVWTDPHNDELLSRALSLVTKEDRDNG